LTAETSPYGRAQPAGRPEEVRADSEDRDRQVGEADAQLTAYGRRNRHLIWITIISLALDLLLTAALTVVAGTSGGAG
jgi:hypothetical protein